MSTGPVGLSCPGCGAPPIWRIGADAFCGTDDCPILVWHPAKIELAANSAVTDLGESS